MITALTLDDIQNRCKYNYEKSEKRIVAIMIARYSIKPCREMIKNQYEFWHFRTGKSMDFFWLGYGAYAFPGSVGQYLVGDLCGEPSVYFDTQVFVEELSKLSRLADLKFNDSIGIYLCNYHDGNVHFNEGAYLDIESLAKGNHQHDLRDFANYIIYECEKDCDIASVVNRFRIKRFKYRIKDIKVSDIISKTIKCTSKIFGP